MENEDVECMYVARDTKGQEHKTTQTQTDTKEAMKLHVAFYVVSILINLLL